MAILTGVIRTELVSVSVEGNVEVSWWNSWPGQRAPQTQAGINCGRLRYAVITVLVEPILKDRLITIRVNEI